MRLCAAEGTWTYILLTFSVATGPQFCVIGSTVSSDYKRILCLRDCNCLERGVEIRLLELFTIWPRILPRTDRGVRSMADFSSINIFLWSSQCPQRVLSSSAPLDYHLKNSPHCAIISLCTWGHVDPLFIDWFIELSITGQQIYV